MIIFLIDHLFEVITFAAKAILSSSCVAKVENYDPLKVKIHSLTTTTYACHV